MQVGGKTVTIPPTEKVVSIATYVRQTKGNTTQVLRYNDC